MTAIQYASPPPQPDLPFADQRGGMKAMGIILILAGAISACGTAMTSAAMLMPMPPGQPRPMARDMVVGVGMYALLAAVFITAGVGALRTRRWSRPVALVLTGSWLLFGALSLASWFLVGPDVQRAMASAGARPGAGGAGGTVPTSVANAIRVIVPLALFVFGVLLPGGIFWFFRRDSVRHTVDHFDPAPSWTDRCPAPVIALGAWLAVASLFTLGYCFWGVFPWFGRLLSGTPGVLALAVTALLLATLSAGVFRRSRLAWAGTLALLVAYAANSMLTFSRVDPTDVYRLSGYPPETVQVMSEMQAVTPAASTVGTALYAAAGLAYLLWVWRYFRRRDVAEGVGLKAPSTTA